MGKAMGKARGKAMGKARGKGKVQAKVKVQARARSRPLVDVGPKMVMAAAQRAPHVAAPPALRTKRWVPFKPA
jgi:hypothetical protein